MDKLKNGIIMNLIIDSIENLIIIQNLGDAHEDWHACAVCAAQDASPQVLRAGKL